MEPAAEVETVESHKTGAPKSWQTVEAQLRQIADDRSRGARELVLAAARAIARGVRQAPAEEGGAERAEALARAVAQAQPEMAPFRHLAAVLLACGVGADALAEAAEDFLRRLEGGATERHAAGLVPERGVVLTYSRSGSVLAALLAAHRSGVRFRVRLSEGRPGYEGRSVAAELAAAGVPVEMTTDAALAGSVPGADLVLLGADAVGRHSFLNKVGSGALCVTARRAGRPVYVLADETKFLPEEQWRPPAERAPREVWEDAPAGVAVSNPYFEAIALADVEAVVSDDGVLAGADLARRVERAAAALAPLERLLGAGGDG